MTTWLTDQGQSVTTIAVEQPDGRFLAYVAHQPDFRATAKTAIAAETAAIEAYEHRHNPAAAKSEDAELAELSRPYENTRGTPWAEVKAKRRRLRGLV